MTLKMETKCKRTCIIIMHFDIDIHIENVRMARSNFRYFNPSTSLRCHSKYLKLA